MDIKITLSKREAEALQVALRSYLDVVHVNVADVRCNASLYSYLQGQLSEMEDSEIPYDEGYCV